MNTNAILNTNDVTRPLTAEETTLLYTLSTKQLNNVMLQIFGEMKEEMESIKAKFADDISGVQNKLYEVANTQTEIMDRISEIKTKPPVHEDPERWISFVYSRAESIAAKQRTISGKIFGKVYAKMRSEYGVDVDAEYSKFRKVRHGSKLMMCSVTPELRMKFEEALSEVASEKIVPEKPKYMPKSLKVQLMPSNIKNICLELEPKKPVTATFHMICKEMERRSGIDIDEFIDTQRPSMPYKAFSKSYFVNGSKLLRPIFNETVKALRRG